MAVKYTQQKHSHFHFKKGQKLTVKKHGGGGITSLVVTLHAVFTSSKGVGDKDAG